MECPARCESCMEEGKCETCYYGYRFDYEVDDCVECKVKNCMNCYENLNTCLQCLPGLYFSFKTRKCEPCSENCLMCSGPKSRDCQKCALNKKMQRFSYERNSLVIEKRKQQILLKYPEYQHQSMLLSSIFHYTFDTYCTDQCYSINDIRESYTDEENNNLYIQNINHVDKKFNDCTEIRMNHPEDRFVDIGGIRSDWDYASQQDHQAKLKKAKENRYGNEYGEVSESQEKRDFFIDDDLDTGL